MQSAFLSLLDLVVRREHRRASKLFMGGHGMRNFVIGCIVLFTMAGTAFSENERAAEEARGRPWARA